MPGNNEWNENLCDCCSDCSSCCYGFWCLPCLFGTNAKKIDDSNCFLMCCIYSLTSSFYLCWIPHYMKRKRLREKYDLKENPCGDCPTATFCGPCAVCQEARELKARKNQLDVSFNSGDNVVVVTQPGQYSNDDDVIKTKI